MKAKRIAALVMAGALCVTTFVGCGINADQTAATLGKQEISVGMANFMCKYQKAALDDMYVQYAGADVWKKDMYGNGTTLEQNLKDSVMDTLHNLYTLEAHMDDYNVSLTAAEKANIEKATKAFLEANSEEALEEMTATEEIVNEVLTLYTIQWKMHESIIADTDREVSDEEANKRGISLVKIGFAGEYNDKGQYVRYTEDQIKAIKANAKKMEETLKTESLEDAAKKHNVKIEDTAYAKNDIGFEKAVLEAMDQLKVGEVSGLIETETALYFVRIDEDCDKKATEENRKSIISQRENKLFFDTLEKWQKDDGWTVDKEAVEDIDFHNILTQKKAGDSTEKTQDTESK